jgi:hypothetical protein
LHKFPKYDFIRKFYSDIVRDAIADKLLTTGTRSNQKLMDCVDYDYGRFLPELVIWNIVPHVPLRNERMVAVNTVG